MSLSDFQRVFHSSEKSQRCKIDKLFWEQMIKEAARSRVGPFEEEKEMKVTFEQFQSTMKNMIRKSWLR